MNQQQPVDSIHFKNSCDSVVNGCIEVLDQSNLTIREHERNVQMHQNTRWKYSNRMWMQKMFLWKFCGYINRSTIFNDRMLTPDDDDTTSSQLQSTIRSFLPNHCEFIWKYIFIYESAKKSPQQQFEGNTTMSAAITMTVDTLDSWQLTVYLIQDVTSLWG